MSSLATAGRALTSLACLSLVLLLVLHKPGDRSLLQTGWRTSRGWERQQGLRQFVSSARRAGRHAASFRQLHAQTPVELFSAWADKWRSEHPEGNLEEEKAAWSEHEKNVEEMRAWEARQVKELEGSNVADDCVYDTFWFQGSIDPSRKPCRKLPPPQMSDAPNPAVNAVEYVARVPQTVLSPPEGPPDFNGQDAMIASHPPLGWAPTDLEEKNAESRGSFSVRMARTGADDEGDINLAIYGPNTPYRCSLRGYRMLSADFQGNSVYTGFSQEFDAGGGTRELQTGFISPGAANEYDVLTCRDEATGEVQYFRINWGTRGYADLQAGGAPGVLGPHFGQNTDSVTFDMDRPREEDEEAMDKYYDLNYDPRTDDKPFY